MDHKFLLKSIKPEHDTFIGIDSDGCVFDSMEVKQKEFFIPLALKIFGLYEISGVLRKTWEFVNLYSIHRGGNRFLSIIKVFELLDNNDLVKSSGATLPDMNPLREWIKSENKLGNESLRKYFEKNQHPDLEKVLEWSETVNCEIGLWLRKIPPFPHAVKALEKISTIADLVIVSQTPLDALNREWEENDIKKYVKFIAAQEHGTKAEHLAHAAVGKYDRSKILMIGDAWGDLNAARGNGVLFYPIIPGDEDSSWEIFINEGYRKFKNGSFAGEYEDALVRKFLKFLPEKWSGL